MFSKGYTFSRIGVPLHPLKLTIMSHFGYSIFRFSGKVLSDAVMNFSAGHPYPLLIPVFPSGVAQNTFAIDFRFFFDILLSPGKFYRFGRSLNSDTLTENYTDISA